MEATHFDDDEDVRSNYLPMIEDLMLSEVPGSQKVVVFDFTIRKASSTKVVNRQVNKIHIDQSPKGAFHRARRHLSEADAESVARGDCRLRIINAWKPIGGTVLDHPLVFADRRSVRHEDLVPVEQVYPDYVGETYVLKYRKGQEFWYWSKMRTTDVLLLQCFDSQNQTEANNSLDQVQCAHGSFELDDSGNEPCNRSSIAVRCLVLG
ncbi:hypothetical protein SLS54_003036 [Diplodia seriata]